MPGIPRPSSLAKADLDTKFHIDYSWWDSPAKLRLYLLSHIQDDTERERLSLSEEGAVVDYVHPDTGEVFRHDELRLALERAAKDPNFINPQASTVDNVFRVFLRNGNRPQTPKELEIALNKPANTILKTIGGNTIYNGIRPILQDEK